MAIPLEVSFTRDESGYVATVRERAIGAERTLVTHGPCSALAEALAAAIALILDSPEEDAAAPAAPVSVPDLHAKRPPDPPSSSPPAAAPDDPSARTAANVVFAEVLGSGLAYSINYERFFGDDASVRVGFGYVRARDANPTFSFSTLRWGTDTQFSFPILANYYYLGHPNHNMHFAAGTTILYRTGQLVDGWYSPANSVYGPEATAGFNLLVNLVIGYRYVPRAGGFTFGGDFMVLFNTVGPLPWCGVNAGAVF